MIYPTAKVKTPATRWHDGQITSPFRKPRRGYPESICQDDPWRNGLRVRHYRGAPEWQHLVGRPDGQINLS